MKWKQKQAAILLVCSTYGLPSDVAGILLALTMVPDGCRRQPPPLAGAHAVHPHAAETDMRNEIKMLCGCGTHNAAVSALTQFTWCCNQRTRRVTRRRRRRRQHSSASKPAKADDHWWTPTLWAIHTASVLMHTDHCGFRESPGSIVGYMSHSLNFKCVPSFDCDDADFRHTGASPEDAITQSFSEPVNWMMTVTHA